MYLQNRESLCLEFNHQAIVADFGCDQEGASTRGSFLIMGFSLLSASEFLQKEKWRCAKQ